MTEHQIFADPSFWEKVAYHKVAALETEFDSGEVMEGVLEFFKDAGCCPFWTLGYLASLADFGSMEKDAADASILSMIPGYDWLKNKATTYATDVHKNIASGRLKDPNFIERFADRKYNAGVTDEITKRIQNSEGFGPSALKWIFGNNTEGAVNAGRAFHEGNTMEGIKQTFNGLAANPTVRQWGSAILPAVGTFAASKLMGAGTGTALALGAGAGALGFGANAAQRFGGWGNALNHYQQKLLPGTAPIASGAAAIPKIPVQQAGDSRDMMTAAAEHSQGLNAIAQNRGTSFQRNHPQFNPDAEMRDMSPEMVGRLGNPGFQAKYPGFKNWIPAQ